MKYIVIKTSTGQELLFAFDTDIMHSEMAEVVRHIKKHDLRGGWDKPYFDAVAISAGFIFKGICQGNSESLGLQSRGMADTNLLSA
jgi:hypothetical protein